MRCHGNGVSSQVVVTNSASSIASSPPSRSAVVGRFGTSPSARAPAGAAAGRGRRSAPSGSRRAAAPAAPGSDRRPTARRAAPARRARAACAVARAVVHRAAQRPLAQPRDQSRQVASGSAVMPAQRRPRAQLAHRPRRRPRRSESWNGSGPSIGTTESSTSASTCCGIAFGVLERDLGAVGGPVQHELLVAESPARSASMSRTDSCVVKAPRAGPICSAQSASRRSSGSLLNRSSAGTAERVGGAGAALVEDQQVASVQRRRHRARGEFGERAARPVRGRRRASSSAEELGSRAGQLARDVSVIVPRTAPERSSGTGSVAARQRRLAGAGQELRRRGGARGCRRGRARQHGSRAVRIVSSARRRIRRRQ